MCRRGLRRGLRSRSGPARNIRAGGAPQALAQGRTVPDHGAECRRHPRGGLAGNNSGPSQGLRGYLFSAQMVRPASRRKPGQVHLGTRAPKAKPPPCMAGAWQLHPLGFVGKTPDYTAKMNLIEKVLDFVRLGGPKWTVDRTIFEMWLGRCKPSAQVRRRRP